MAKVLVVGSGSRELSIARKLEESDKVSKIYIYPGNDGTTGTKIIRENGNFDMQSVIKKAGEGFDLVVVCSEQLLSLGIADRLASKGIRCFGATGAASKLECSRVYAKEFMMKYSIPTARFNKFRVFQEAKDFIENNLDYDVVCKASGLNPGKGVLIPEDRGDKKQIVNLIHRILIEKEFGVAGSECIIEEYLQGTEVSVMALCDGRKIACFPAVHAYKRLMDEDQGPVTPGMGAYTPSLDCFPGSKISREIESYMKKIVDSLRDGEKIPFIGCLCADIMITPDSGPVFIEINVSFGDPETQVLMPLLQSDLYDLLLSVSEFRLEPSKSVFDIRKTSCNAFLVSHGYPGKYERGMLIDGIQTFDPLTGIAKPIEKEEQQNTNVLVAGAGVAINVLSGGMINRNARDSDVSVTLYHEATILRDNQFFVNGGRALSFVAVGYKLKDTVDGMYEVIKRITTDPPDSLYYRKDIALQTLQIEEMMDSDAIRMSANTAIALASPGITAARETLKKGMSFGFYPIIAASSIVVVAQSFTTCAVAGQCKNVDVNAAVAGGIYGFVIALAGEITKRLELRLLEKLIVLLMGFSWTLMALLYTFIGPFLVTSNGYFAAWGSCFVSFVAIETEFRFLEGVNKRVQGVDGSYHESIVGQCMLVILFSSIVVVLASIHPCVLSCTETTLYAIIVGSISVVTSSVMVILAITSSRIHPKGLYFVSIGFVFLWFISTCILTFAGSATFTLTGNGYFGVWFALISSLALYRESYKALDIPIIEQTQGIGDDEGDVNQSSSAAVHDEHHPAHSLATI